jgi:hypothetical protein
MTQYPPARGNSAYIQDETSTLEDPYQKKYNWIFSKMCRVSIQSHCSLFYDKCIRHAKEAEAAWKTLNSPG